MEKKNVVHTHTHKGKMLTHKKKDEVLPFVPVRMDLVIIMLSEISQAEKTSTT